MSLSLSHLLSCGSKNAKSTDVEDNSASSRDEASSISRHTTSMKKTRSDKTCIVLRASSAQIEERDLVVDPENYEVLSKKPSFKGYLMTSRLPILFLKIDGKDEVNITRQLKVFLNCLGYLMARNFIIAFPITQVINLLFIIMILIRTII